MTSIDTLLLWDIDGTLLTTNRAGIKAWEDALQVVLGTEVDLAEYPTSGLTDWMIARDLLLAHGDGASDAQAEWELIGAYTSALPGRLQQRRGHLLPNVTDALAALASTGRVVNSLLTGNARAGAAAKLTTYGIAEWFLEGGFCDDGFDRATIGARAIERVANIRPAVSRDRTFEIGDTPLDVQCARALEVRALAVATGTYTRDELEIHEPWVSFDQLPPASDLLELLGLADDERGP